MKQPLTLGDIELETICTRCAGKGCRYCHNGVVLTAHGRSLSILITNAREEADRAIRRITYELEERAQ